ncbi:MAG: glycosyltransferase [Rhodothermaceae bacterium]|nr:glycosyltransferase [Rhodothermaceae bacterium]
MSTQPPRVLFVDHAAVMGGAEWSLLSLARRWRSERAVTLFEDGPFRQHLNEAEVPVDILPASAAVLGATRGGGAVADLLTVPGILALATRLARQARRFDVLYANSQKALVIGAVAALLARRPLVWHLRDIITADHFSPARRRLAVGLANRRAAYVICNSEATAEAFMEAGGDPNKVRVVYNGISPAPFDAVAEDEVAQVRMALGVGETPVIGVFSRLAQWKGQHVLLEALAYLSEAHALLVGDALFAEDRVYADALRAQAASLGVTERVHFLGFRDDVPVLMKACDVVVHTSVAPEPFGRVLVEGALAGRPVVATDAGGAPEVINDGETGHLVPPGDAQALADTLRTLLTDPIATPRIAEAGRQRALDHFSEEAMVRAVEATLLDER